MELHYLIIASVVVLILIFQIVIFCSSLRKQKTFKTVFPNKDEAFTLGNRIIYVDIDPVNPVLATIWKSINSYLRNNSGAVSDYHLIKDIVDRNCDAAEDEISAQIPVPLYYGLTGTMAGILIGVGFLVEGGGLDALLQSSNSGKGSEGIQALMGGVALAMISSIVGILLTTIGSLRFRTAKARMERNKNVFLSWIQTTLLPQLSNDVGDMLNKMVANLSRFNEVFSSNTGDLRAALDTVNESVKNQAELMTGINQLKIRQIATANIKVYDKLKNCTAEIGRFGNYIHSVNEYIASVRDLNEKLDRNENRTKAIEDMAVFFKQEKEIFEERRVAMNTAVGRMDETLQRALSQLGDHTETQLRELQKAAGKQQDALQRKLDETGVLIDELKNLTAVKTGVNSLEKATQEQNKKLDRLIVIMEKMAAQKQPVQNLTDVRPTDTLTEENTAKNISIQWNLKIFVLTVGILIILMLFYLIFNKLI
ncbi:MAG: hypothetical protein LBD59_09510 [Prevotellaceae bacterium]|jgi:methyl-accepting chemotaxis protein|nr:hypothetical protein [Prevotellaceae bacterium]